MLRDSDISYNLQNNLSSQIRKLINLINNVPKVIQLVSGEDEVLAQVSRIPKLRWVPKAVTVPASSGPARTMVLLVVEKCLFFHGSWLWVWNVRRWWSQNKKTILIPCHITILLKTAYWVQWTLHYKGEGWTLFPSYPTNFQCTGKQKFVCMASVFWLRSNLLLYVSRTFIMLMYFLIKMNFQLNYFLMKTNVSFHYVPSSIFSSFHKNYNLIP